MTPKIEYILEVDSARDGLYSGASDNITQYLVGNITWSEGFTDNPYGEIAPPARMTLTLSNRSGDFNRDGYLSDELILNGDFDDWVADAPDPNPAEWTVYEPNPLSAFVFQTNPYDGLGSIGACGFSASLQREVSITQSVLQPGRSYRARVELTRFISFPTSVAALEVRSGSNSIGYLSNVQRFVFDFNAATTDFTIAASLPGVDRSIQAVIDNVSVREIPKYAVMNKGMQVRLRATYNGVTSTLFQGRITQMIPSAGRSTEPLMQVTVEDAMLELLDAEYAPPLLIAPTADTALQRMFDDAVIRWPYSGSFWLLGVPGYSELNLSTYLYDHDVTDFETGITTFEYLGDVEDRGEGISAQGYIRDIVTAEAGGRFWFDPRSGKFILHNRHHDALNDTIAAIYNENHFDAVVPKYGDDIVNDLTIRYTSRDVGAEGSVLWTLKSIPFLLKNNNKRIFNARYFDANNEQLHVGARTTIAPVAGTDFTANLASDGSGESYSDRITVSVEASGNSAKIAVFNNSGVDLYILSLQLRGTPITQIEESYQAVAGDSIAANELYPKVIEVRALDNSTLAELFGDYTVARFKNPIFRFETVTFNTLNYSDGDLMADAAINRMIGDKITISDSSTSHNKTYVIVAAMHSLDSGGDKPHDVTWTLKPIDRDAFWVLEVAGKSELDLTTYLAF